MQMVIDIPDGCYEELTTANFPIQDAYRLVAWIKDGTPLPKGHGRLIDADTVEKEMNKSEVEADRNAEDVRRIGGRRMIVTKTTMHCDRCGKEIEAHNPYYTVNITPEYFRLITHKLNKIYELCPDCHKWLKNGITNKSEENNEDSN